MSTSQHDGADAPAASSVPREGTKNRLQSGPGPQYKHKEHIKSYLNAFREAHSDCRLFACIQSGYSTDIVVVLAHNISGYGPRMSDLFSEACTKQGGRVVVARLRSELAELGDPVLVAKVTERLLELFLADGVVGRKQAGMMRSCVVGAKGLDDGEWSCGASVGGGRREGRSRGEGQVMRS